MNDISSSARVGVLGAGGYTGRELIRILSRHPRVEIGFATSESEAGSSMRTISRQAPDLPLCPAADAPLAEMDLVFSCLPHGASGEWVERVRAAGTRAIDLSADLRVPGPATPAWASEAVFGLPELHRAAIAGAELVANPGCYPTAATLSLAPLVRREMISDAPVVINAASGVTGAGRSPKRDYLFGEVAEDYRAYAVGNVHRHLAEMRDQVARLAPGDPPELIFAPHLLPIRRGILETIYIHLRPEVDIQAAIDSYTEDYADEPFVEVLPGGSPRLVDVVGTNLTLIAPNEVQGVSSPMLMVVSAIDNLVKGASGQAVQNMNVMFGWPEAEGLT